MAEIGYGLALGNRLELIIEVDALLLVARLQQQVGVREFLVSCRHFIDQVRVAGCVDIVPAANM